MTFKGSILLKNGTVFHAALGRGDAPLCASSDFLIASVFAMTWRYLQSRLTWFQPSHFGSGSVRVDVPAVRHVKGATEVVVLRVASVDISGTSTRTRTITSSDTRVITNTDAIC